MLTKYNNNNEIGIDEAGRGPLIGRVYAGAVIWPVDVECDLIKDSKKLSKKKRQKALSWIKENISCWGVGYAEHYEIDHYNILEATKLAMQRAIDNLKVNIDDYELIIDGYGWYKKFPDYKVHSIIEGDNKYYSIAAASIIAKEYHDNHIQELCSEDNELDNKYGLLKNMGYGTKKHIDGIKTYGISNYHRKTFKPASLLVT